MVTNFLLLSTLLLNNLIVALHFLRFRIILCCVILTLEHRGQPNLGFCYLYTSHETALDISKRLSLKNLDIPVQAAMEQSYVVPFFCKRRIYVL
jgi:hypothetical protein